MGASGLENGRKISGLMPGIKSGRTLSQMKGGLVGGLSNGIMNHRNMQNPTLLIGSKAPLIYWNAESCTVNASNNVLSAANLITSSAETLTVSSDPNRTLGDVFSGKGGVAFDATDFIGTSAVLGNKTDATVIVVAKPNSVSGAYIFNCIWSSFDTVGDFWMTADTGIVTSTFLGSPTGNRVTVASYRLIPDIYYIFTIKVRLTKTSGKDALEVFVNGVKQSNYTSDTFAPGSVIQDTAIRFGGNSSQTLGGNSIGAALIFDYYLENHEQLRIENYLRWYYGRNF